MNPSKLLIDRAKEIHLANSGWTFGRAFHTAAYFFFPKEVKSYAYLALFTAETVEEGDKRAKFLNFINA